MTNIIDVTLRDGGYLNNFSFPQSYVLRHVSLMAEAGLEWIEIGYRNGSSKPTRAAGDAAYCPGNFIRQVRTSAQDANLCVIGHPKNLEYSDIEELASEGVSMLRICCSADSMKKANGLIRFAHESGLMVCSNLIRSNSLRLNEFLKLSEQASRAGADVIYIADSNGSMQPHRVETFVRSVLDEVDCAVGFHAHDHLGLAMSNSLAAVDAGATFIDASLRGVGKGAGNLRLEAWISFLSKQRHGAYNVNAIFLQLPLLESVISSGVDREAWLEVIMAFHDLSLDERSAFPAGDVDIAHDLRTAQKLAEMRAGV